MAHYGRELIAQTQVETRGEGKDVMSVLMRANEAEEARLRLSDREVISQISCVVCMTMHTLCQLTCLQDSFTGRP